MAITSDPDSVGQGLLQSERTKKDRLDDRTETEKRRIDMGVISGCT